MGKEALQQNRPSMPGLSTLQSPNPCRSPHSADCINYPGEEGQRRQDGAWGVSSFRSTSNS